jgi:hypothetical protein
MESEREIFRGPHAGGDPAEGTEGPDVERLQNLRNQARSFDSTIGRALASFQQKSQSAKDILHSIRNPGGE